MRKLGALLLCMVLMISLASAAYAVPDRMTTYMLQTILTEANFNFAIGEDTAPGDAVRQSIYDAVDSRQIAPIDWWTLDCFGAPVKTAAQALTSGDVEAMTLCSFASVDVSGYDPDKFGDEQAVFHFVNEYPLNLSFVAVVGALKDGAAERLASGETIDPIDLYDWQALRAEPVDPSASVDTDDGIRVHFTKDALTMVSDKDAVVALLCAVAPGTYSEAIVETPGTPSKTVDDVTTIEVYDDNDIPNLIVDVISPLDARGQQAFDDVYRFTATDRRNAIDYFSDEVRADIGKFLPDADLTMLTVNDFTGTIAHNYNYAHGEILVTATFPTVYADGTKAVALVGVFKDDGSVVWTPLKAEAVDGSVRVSYTQNVITRIEEENSVLMILREAAE